MRTPLSRKLGALVAVLLLPCPLLAQPLDTLQAARTAFIEGRFEDAIARLEMYSAADASATALYLRGRSHQALLEHEAALTVLQAAHAHDTSSTRILQALGHSYAALHRFDAAEEAYARALERTPSRALRLWLADLYRRMRAWPKAIRHYRTLLRSDSANALLHARLAQSLAAHNRPESALTHYRRAHRINPRSASIALPLSRLLAADEQTAPALQVVDRTLEHQHTAALWKQRAALAFKQDSLAAAAVAYERAIERGDSSAVNFRHLGIAYTGVGRHAAALDALRRAHRRDSTDAHTYFYLGVAYREVDSLHQSAAAFERAIDLAARDVLVDAYLQAAVTYDAQHELAAALRAYRTALRVQPRRTAIHFHLATLYDRYYRDKTTAALYYRKFLTASDTLRTPFHEYATRRLEQLRPTLHFQQGRTP